MENFKIDNFVRENPSCIFPDVLTLTQDETLSIRSKLIDLLKLDPTVDSLKLINFLWGKSSAINSINAEEEDFNFLEIIRLAGITPKQSVLVNWDRMETIDQIRLDDFCKYFSDIWYPSSDDIEVFDDSLTWMVFVGHSGDIRLTQLRT
jgi:hypothetical protein